MANLPEEAAGRTAKRCCDLFEVSRAVYYERRRGVPSAREVSDAALTEKITAVHTASKGTYGSLRVHAELCRQGVCCGRRRVPFLYGQATEYAAGVAPGRPAAGVTPERRWEATPLRAVHLAGQFAQPRCDIVQADLVVDLLGETSQLVATQRVGGLLSSRVCVNGVRPSFVVWTGLRPGFAASGSRPCRSPSFWHHRAFSLGHDMFERSATRLARFALACQAWYASPAPSSCSAQ